MLVFELESNNMSYITKDFDLLLDKLLYEEEKIIEGYEYKVRTMEMSKEDYEDLEQFEGF